MLHTEEPTLGPQTNDCLKKDLGAPWRGLKPGAKGAGTPIGGHIYKGILSLSCEDIHCTLILSSVE